MSGLVILSVVALWAWLGFALWKLLVRPRIRSVAALCVVTVGLALLWFVGPVADEILGAREFKRLCDEMPAVKFYGPVSIGSGPFFHEDGTPKWRTKEEFEDIDLSKENRRDMRGKRQLGVLFNSRVETLRVQDWPIPVLEERQIYSFVPSGEIILVGRFRGSPGGWIQRWSGWGNHAPYQCGAKGVWPQDWEWIKF